VTVLIGCIAIERERLERIVLARIHSGVAWSRQRFAGSTSLDHGPGGLGV